jgi:hypothetical protein
MPSKKEDKDLEYSELYDQIISYMHVLQNIHGVLEVFAIITTYNEWKILWMEESKTIAGISTVAQLQEYFHDETSYQEFCDSTKALNMWNNSGKEQKDSSESGEEKLTSMEDDEQVEEQDEEQYEFDEGDEAFEAEIEEEVDLSLKVEEKQISIYETACYRHDNPALVEILCSLVYKMTYVRIRPTAVFAKQIDISTARDPRNYILVDDTTFFWARLPKDFRPSLDFNLAHKCKYYYFLQDYHGGRDGRVYLGADKMGNICVIKWSPEGTRTYSAESAAWNHIWNARTRTQTVFGVNALIMPYVFHAYQKEDGTVSFRSLRKWNLGHSDVEDFVDNGTKQTIDKKSIEKYLKNPLLAAKAAITKMVDKGYVHEDVKWSHVGLLPFKTKGKGTYSVKPVLIDLHEIRKLGDGEDKKEVVQKFLTDLEENT